MRIGISLPVRELQGDLERSGHLPRLPTSGLHPFARPGSGSPAR